jgi:lipoate-protein ligase A
LLCRFFAGAFHLRENDFCFGPRKFGGNAQSITRQRFCHHTSFLCDFDDAAMMRYLKLPGLCDSTLVPLQIAFSLSGFYRLHFPSCQINAEKAPSYRGGRSHLEFLCKLKDAFAHHHSQPPSGTPSALAASVDRAQYAADELCTSLRRTLDEEFEVWRILSCT